MKQIIAKFPYFDHTTARIMAVAMHLAATTNPSNPIFDRDKAISLVDAAFANFRSKKDIAARSLLVIDVCRYWYKLTSIQ
jgi:hypothetical protein